MVRGALARHRVVAAAIVVAALAVIPLAALGEAHRLLGDYGVTATEGSVLPPGVWKAAVIHVDLLALGLGVVPFLLGDRLDLLERAIGVRAGAGVRGAPGGLTLPLLVPRPLHMTCASAARP